MSDEAINLDAGTVDTTTEVGTADIGIDDGSKELGVLDQMLSGQVVEQPPTDAGQPEAVIPPETTPTETAIDEAALLKKYGLPGNSLEELAGKYNDLGATYGNKLQPLNWAAKNAPGLLGEFYQKLDLEIKKSQGLPVPEATTPANQDIQDELSQMIDPETGEPYTQDRINATVKLIDAAAKRAGYFKKQEYQSEKAAQESAQTAQKVKADADKAFGDFKGVWEPKLKEMGQDFNTVLKGMDEELAVFGIGPQDYHRITPEVLGRALNGYLTRSQGGLELLMKNYAANTQKNNITKKGMAVVIPKGGSRGDAEVPMEKIDDLVAKGNFKGAEAMLARQLEIVKGMPR
jgi:hypothetical protein